MQKANSFVAHSKKKYILNAGASSLLEDGHSKKDGHNHSEHSDEDGHDHSKGNDSVVKMFLPAMNHYVYYLLLLLLIIIFHNRGLQVG
jgi:Cd2+/Zn2+-exporting ATPase